MLEQVLLAWMIIFGVGFFVSQDEKISERCLMMASILSGIVIAVHNL